MGTRAGSSVGNPGETVGHYRVIITRGGNLPLVSILLTRWMQ